jgi:D-arabinose 1-dehydrogenase-like Zn-dependent alcohol dehydrogenase
VLVGAAGGVGSFATQLAANACAYLVAVAGADAGDRLRSYGAAEVIDYTAGSVPDALRRAHPDDIDVLIDLANNTRRTVLGHRHLHPLAGTASRFSRCSVLTEDLPSAGLVWQRSRAGSPLSIRC